MNSLNSIAKLLTSSIKSHVVLTRHVSTIKLNNTNNNSISQNKFTKKSTIPHQNSTKIPKGFFKITLIRSTIGLPAKRKKVARALGFRRLQQTVYHAQTAYIAGMILKIKEILRVRNVKRIPAPEERIIRAEKGYVIVKKHTPDL